VLYGTSAVVIRRLQMVLNAATGLIVGLGKYERITPVLHDVLHGWPLTSALEDTVFKIATVH